MLRDRKVSPVEVTQAALARIAKVDERLKSFVTVTADLALTAARAPESEIVAGRWRGPLHGVPIGLKDLFDTAGVVTTNGSRNFRLPVPAAVSVVIAKHNASGGL